MSRGISLCGESVSLRHAGEFRVVDSDVAVFYGYMKHIMGAYRVAKKPFVYVDLGYWGRHEGGRRAGYHKVSVNGRHPTAYFQRRPKSGDRFAHFGIPIKDYRENLREGFILLAGMSEKAANAEGYAAQAWETSIVSELRRHTSRRILYRPKPNWQGARPIKGSEFISDYYKKELTPDLKGCYAVVSHHSNVNVDSLLEGIPSFCLGGAAAPMSLGDLSRVERPYYPENRQQWANDLAYTQWNIEEMETGTAWRFLKNEGLIP